MKALNSVAHCCSYCLMPIIHNNILARTAGRCLLAEKETETEPSVQGRAVE